MRVEVVPVAEAGGQVLMHNFVGSDGRKLVPKGRRLAGTDLEQLRAAGAFSVCVAVLEAGDVGEDEAAQALAEAVSGAGLEASPPRGGRVDLVADRAGLLKVDRQALRAVNGLAGVAVATARGDEPVAAKRRVATVKVLPYALPGATLDAVRALCAGAGAVGLIGLKPYVVRSAVWISTGRPEARGEQQESLGTALGERLAVYGIELLRGPHAAADEGGVRRGLTQALGFGADLVLVTGETSVADADDLTPRGLRSAGARVVQCGVPVEPGSLLLLAYHGDIPIVGVPGCVRSPRPNAFDLVLPRLAAGERLEREDLLGLGYGGLLE